MSDEKILRLRYAFWKGLIVISLALNVFWAFFFFMIYKIGDDIISIRDVSPDLKNLLIKQQPNLEYTLDAISYSQQLGRLDILSLILAMFAIIVGVFAISWFGNVKDSAKKEAREAAQIEVRDCINDYTSEAMKSSYVLNRIDDKTRDRVDEILTKEKIQKRDEFYPDEELAKKIADSFKP